MLNNFYKTIHIKYSRFFEFIFFLRYLLIIFFISIAIFLTIPIFFNYEKKAEIIKLHLLENYDFKISSYEKIKYNIFPLPNLEFKNTVVNLKSSEKNLQVEKMKIYLNFLNIYDYKNFNSNKIVLKDSELVFQILKFKNLANLLFIKKKKLIFNNLNLRIENENISVLSLDNIKFANYGYNENIIRGKAFGKKFRVKIDDKYKNINLKFLNAGINADVLFDEKQTKSFKGGIFKFKILNNNFKSNFEYDGKFIKLYNSYFRSKNLSFKNKSEIILNPFLDIDSKFFIEEFNPQILRKVDLNKLLNYKDFLRKINNKSEINFKSKKFNRKLFDDINLKFKLAYGRVNFSKKLSSNNSSINCDGNINFLEEYPILFFECHVKSDNKKGFLRKFSVKTKSKNEIFELKIKGNLSLLNGKINFKNISMNDSYNASKEDLKYFKIAFENILFDEDFLKIFDLKKVKDFITEIS